MKVSLKTAYACQVLAQLGHSYGLPALPHIEELADAENIPANYLVQILNELRTAGLITSRRGKQGGYALARDPADLSMRDIIVAIEGEVLGVPALGGASATRTVNAWKVLARELDAKAASISVADLMRTGSGDMYYI